MNQSSVKCALKQGKEQLRRVVRQVNLEGHVHSTCSSMHVHTTCSCCIIRVRLVWCLPRMLVYLNECASRPSFCGALHMGSIPNLNNQIREPTSTFSQLYLSDGGPHHLLPFLRHLWKTIKLSIGLCCYSHTGTCAACCQHCA